MFLEGVFNMKFCEYKKMKPFIIEVIFITDIAIHMKISNISNAFFINFTHYRNTV